MKLLRYGQQGSEKPGMLDEQGNIRDLSGYLSDFNPPTLGDEHLLSRLSSLDPAQLPLVDHNIRLGASVGMPGKIICIGYNSHLHAAQMGVKPLTKDMVVFMKPMSSVCGPFDPILYTRMTRKLDWEAELGIVIGKQGKYISEDEARDYIFGYTCVNDISDRYFQLETEDTQFTKGKCFDNAAPIGPYLVTREAVLDSSNLQVTLHVNGEIRQNFNTSDYIHSDVEIIHYLSQFFTLYPGDIISMGSAPGTAKSWGDQFLKPDDVVLFSISGLGQQEHLVVVE